MTIDSDTISTALDALEAQEDRLGPEIEATERRLRVLKGQLEEIQRAMNDLRREASER